MAVGSQFARYINPLLAVLKNLGGSAKAAEAKGAVADFLRLSDDVLEDRLESGSSRFDNQVAWARYYLARAGYIDASRRGVWALTEKGRNTTELTDEAINDLVQGVIAEWGRRPQNVERPAGVDGSGRSEAEAPSPDEALGDHRSHLLNLIKGLPAAGFERLSQRLLREAGFEKVTVTGRAGDGGIDGVGVVEVNAFVSFKVLFQCKRYRDTPVGPSAVRDFRGAMQGRADKGLILTTASFTAEARREAGRDGAPPIELVDGEKLVDLFEQLELGLVPRKAYQVIESFFDEFKD